MGILFFRVWLALSKDHDGAAVQCERIFRDLIRINASVFQTDLPAVVLKAAGLLIHYAGVPGAVAVKKQVPGTASFFFQSISVVRLSVERVGAQRVITGERSMIRLYRCSFGMLRCMNACPLPRGYAADQEKAARMKTSKTARMIARLTIVPLSIF